jgi:environmental stress-induced protein Ves
MARLIAHAGLLPAPWKNGGGSTTEIALCPAGAGFDDFDWRISLATVAHSGPFSLFPGVDRSLALVAGAGMTLVLDGAEPRQLNAATPLIRFAGEAAVQAWTGAAPSTDFNVMTRRARCQHQLTRHPLSGGMTLTRNSASTLLFLAEGSALQAGRAALARYDALLLDATDPATLTLFAPAPVVIFIVDIEPCRPRVRGDDRTEPIPRPS